MENTFFITGTDTEVGKTYVSNLLLSYFKSEGYSTKAMKPIASGCEILNGQLKNEDALILQKSATKNLIYNEVNPFAFEPAIAPHIAANVINFNLSKEKVRDKINQFLKIDSDISLIEGAGGWHLPLNQNELLSELIGELNIPVILVVGMKLGALNHAILTANAIINSGCKLAGWVSNIMNPKMPYLKENIIFLEERFNALGIPCLAKISLNQKQLKLNKSALFNGCFS